MVMAAGRGSGRGGVVGRPMGGPKPPPLAVVVDYPWHPLHGKRVSVLRRIRIEGAVVVHVDVAPPFCRELPEWMFDRAICSAMASGPPVVSLAALNELREVLQALRSSLQIEAAVKEQIPLETSRLTKAEFMAASGFIG